MNIKTLLITLALGISLTSVALKADDTEIYTNPGGGASGVPLVMFSLDYRSNLNSTYNACTRIGSGTDADPYCSAVQYFVDEGIDPVAEGLSSTAKLTLFDALRLALKLVLQEIHDVKIGLMFSHKHEQNAEGPSHGHNATGNNRKSNGGTILMGFQLLDPVDNTTRENFDNKLRALKSLTPASSNADHSYQGREMFFEFFRYLTGGDVYNGHNGWTDFEQGNSVDRNTNMRCSSADPLLALACWDSSIEIGQTTYKAALDGVSDCTRVYTVNLFFGQSNQTADSDNAIQASRNAGGTGDSSINTDPEMIAFLHGTDLGSFLATDPAGRQNVTSYFLYDGQQQNTVNGYAQAGGTGSGIRIDVPPDVLIDSLITIFNEILSVSATFVSANLPVNSFNRADVLDNVLFALFQLDPDVKPNWSGNVKRLRKQDNVDPNTGETTSLLVDVNGVNAVAADNRFKFDALTYWTDPTGADVVAADATEGEVAGKDGRSVDRGGAGQKIPGFLSGNPGDDNNDTGARKLFTEPDPGDYTNGLPSDSLLAFDADSTDTDTAEDLRADFGVLGVAGDYDADADGDIDDVDHSLSLMRWLRGQDSGNATDRTAVRPWLMGDILHSRPLVINYGSRGGYTQANQDLRIITGTNHGVLHMFRNSNESTGNPDGSETWAFIPRATLGASKVLRLNTVGADHPYGVDGPVSALINDGFDGELSGTDTAWIYFGLRRGGKSYYSLDVSSPDTPKLLWTVDSAPGTGTEELGMTFSPVRIGKVQYGPNAVEAVFVAGGYDANKDASGVIGTDDSEGNAVYILNAETGSVIWKAVYDATPDTPGNTRFESSQLKDSIPAEIGLIDANSNGIVDRAYVPDTGGRLWRIDLPESANSSESIRQKWSMTLLADLGRHVENTAQHDRRFFHGVDVAQLGGDTSTWYIALGSGDRAHPKETTHANGLAVIKDSFTYNATTGTLVAAPGELPIERADLEDITNNCIQEGGCAVAPDLTYGWYLVLGEGAGEKVLSSPLIANDVVFFTTYLPNNGNSGVCLPDEGAGVAYAVRLDNGGAAFDNDQSNNATCSNEEGLCVEDRIFVPVGEMPPGIPSDPVPVPPDKTLIGTKFKSIGASNTERTFWYQIEDVGVPN